MFAGRPAVSSYLFRICSLTASYIALAWLGLSVAEIEGTVSPFWPASGLGIAALTLWGFRLWPAIAVGTFAANFFLADNPIGVAVGIAVGNTLEACVGALVMRRLNVAGEISCVRDAAVLLAVVLLAPVPSFVGGALSMFLGGMSPWDGLPWICMVWLLGHSLGAFIGLPLILAWGGRRVQGSYPDRPGEFAGATALVVALTTLAYFYGGSLMKLGVPFVPPALFVFPPTVWALLRLRPRNAIAVMAIGATGAVIFALLRIAGSHNLGPLIFLYLVLMSVGGGWLILIGAVVQRKNTEEKLHNLSLVVEQSPESIVVTNLNAEIEYVNDAFIRNTGYSFDEIRGKNPRILHSGKTPPQTFASLWESLTQGRAWSGEFYNMRKDGSEYIEHALVAPIVQPDGKITHYVAVKEDITGRRQLEEDLVRRQAELQELYAALQTAREEERRRLARELHDDLGQRATALRMDVDWLEAKVPPTTPLVPAKMANVSAQIDGLTDSIRRLIENMRPGMLDVLGLVAALEDYVSKFATRTGIHCELTTSPSQIRVSDQIGINTFRIVQEALNNVQKYAQATRVSVRLEQSDDQLSLAVEDNGIGMPQTADGGKHGFGVRGMKERVAILNGQFSITSLPGQGVRIEVVVPT